MHWTWPSPFRCDWDTQNVNTLCPTKTTLHPSLLEQKPDGPQFTSWSRTRRGKQQMSGGWPVTTVTRARCPRVLTGVRNTRSQETPSTRGSGVQICSVVSWRPAHQQHNITTSVSSVSKWFLITRYNFPIHLNGVASFSRLRFYCQSSINQRNTSVKYH